MPQGAQAPKALKNNTLPAKNIKKQSFMEPLGSRVWESTSTLQHECLQVGARGNQIWELGTMEHSSGDVRSRGLRMTLQTQHCRSGIHCAPCRIGRGI